MFLMIRCFVSSFPQCPLIQVPKPEINIMSGQYPLATILFILRMFLYRRFEGPLLFCPPSHPFASLALLASLYIFLGIVLRSSLRWSSHLCRILLSYLVLGFGVTFRRCAHNICANYVCDIHSREKRHTHIALHHSSRETTQIFPTYNTVGAGAISSS